MTVVPSSRKIFSLALLPRVRGTSTMMTRTTTETFECTRESLLKGDKWAPPVSWQRISKLFLFLIFDFFFYPPSPEPLGQSCSHCKQTTPGFEWNPAETTSSGQSRGSMGCFSFCVVEPLFCPRAQNSSSSSGLCSDFWKPRPSWCFSLTPHPYVAL